MSTNTTKPLVKKPTYPDGQEYSEDEYKLITAQMDKRGLTWEKLVKEKKTGRDLLENLDPDVIQQVITAEDRAAELAELGGPINIKSELNDWQKRRKLGRRIRKAIVFGGVPLLILLTGWLLFSQVSCSSHKAKNSAISTNTEKLEEPVPIETKFETTSEYWWISKGTTFYLLLISTIIGAIGLIVVVAYRKRRYESTGDSSVRSVGTALLALSMIGLAILGMQSYAAKNRNRVIEKGGYPINLDVGERKHIQDSMRRVFNANPVRDTEVVRQRNEAITMLTYWRLKAKDDSLKYAAEKKGIDSVIVNGLIADGKKKKDSFGIAITALKHNADSLRKITEEQQKKLVQTRVDSAKMAERIALLQKQKNDEPKQSSATVLSPMQPPLDENRVGVLIMLTLGIACMAVAIWRKKVFAIPGLVLLVAGMFFAFGSSSGKRPKERDTVKTRQDEQVPDRDSVKNQREMFYTVTIKKQNESATYQPVQTEIPRSGDTSKKKDSDKVKKAKVPIGHKPVWNPKLKP